ncbi:MULTISPECIES: beta-N-acetylhexosaminidase [unclassified Granulicatella]|uniref:beta-N-acetylhexosaminidase n=1 Tax=unclassified Granulicatella TaxID=2630493 RepID=UPI001073019F|nr:MULTISPECIES: beta-N-acetylhexosaminidase [unclassified Granulicatella]MBF0780690.1 beta-N-acetylhexosaminidase [Granulicatella sp. 19428wC4_WM01]TFU94232.1 beta-N-acetylhexosaminidase [Granulicatella sp. WM01]
MVINGITDELNKRVKSCVEYLRLTDCQLQFEKSCDLGFRIVGDNGIYTIFYEKEYMIFRALTHLKTQLKKGQKKLNIKQEPAYQELGYMLDASRNAVITPRASKRLIQLLALMGYSNFQLYMEDTYELRDEAYFGYFRGRYTIDELKDIEIETESYGMSFIPCIQTLAHLSAYVKWSIHDIQIKRDVDDILLIGNQEVYTLIDKMFETLSHLKTRCVNIGMDEAHLVGLGRYLNEHGYQNRSLLMCQHLERVLDIADKYGFKCSMWSDMFFQLLTASKNYDGDLTIDEDTRVYLDKLKTRVELIYWDYYQTTEENYAQKFEKHRQITSENIAFAGGVWKWIGYTPDNEFSLKIAPCAHQACLRYQVKHVSVTGWGDNGGECSAFSVLPSLQAWAEYQYTNGLENFAQHFETIHGLAVERFLTLDLANLTPSNPRETSGINPGRYILYQDVLCPLLDKHIDHEKDAKHFEESAKTLSTIAQQGTEWSYLFDTQAKLCQILAIKARVSHDIRASYHAKDIQALREHIEQLRYLHQLLREFRSIYSYQWLHENKVFGLDTIDIRLGGLQARIERAIERIELYIAGKLIQIDELEVAILPYNDFYKDRGYVATTANQWHLIATASTIYTT